MRILSPFDNAVIQRDRITTIFDFDYQIECYVPSKSKYGYFCLPRCTAISSLAADQGGIESTAYWSSRRYTSVSIRSTSTQQLPYKPRLPEFAAFQGCDAIALTKVTPTRLHRLLQAEIEETQCNTRTLNT